MKKIVAMMMTGLLLSSAFCAQAAPSPVIPTVTVTDVVSSTGEKVPDDFIFQVVEIRPIVKPVVKPIAKPSATVSPDATVRPGVTVSPEDEVTPDAGETEEIEEIEEIDEEVQAILQEVEEMKQEILEFAETSSVIEYFGEEVIEKVAEILPETVDVQSAQLDEMVPLVCDGYKEEFGDIDVILDCVAEYTEEDVLLSLIGYNEGEEKIWIPLETRVSEDGQVIVTFTREVLKKVSGLTSVLALLRVE